MKFGWYWHRDPVHPNPHPLCRTYDGWMALYWDVDRGAFLPMSVQPGTESEFWSEKLEEPE